MRVTDADEGSIGESRAREAFWASSSSLLFETRFINKFTIMFHSFGGYRLRGGHDPSVVIETRTGGLGNGRRMYGLREAEATRTQSGR